MSKGLKGLWILLNLYHFFNTFSLGGVSRNFVVTDAQSLKLSSPTTSRDITNPQLFLFPTVLMPGNFLKNSGAVAWNGLDPQVFQIDFHNFGVNSGGVVFLMFFLGDIQEKERLEVMWCPCFFLRHQFLGELTFPTSVARLWNMKKRNTFSVHVIRFWTFWTSEFWLGENWDYFWCPTRIPVEFLVSPFGLMWASCIDRSNGKSTFSWSALCRHLGEIWRRF